MNESANRPGCSFGIGQARRQRGCRCFDLYQTGSGFKHKVEGRRMRLCKYIEVVLVKHGWQEVRWNRFRQPSPRKEQQR